MRPGTLAVAAALLLLAGVALALRLVGAEHVLAGDRVVIAIGDGVYHARLALWAHANFPRWLTWDPYLSAPAGGPVPWPPLLDLAVAGAAHLLGGGARTVERVLAWAAPVSGALATAAVYAVGRQVAGVGAALGAAALYAGFGLTIQYGAIGNGDHHATVAAEGAAWLALALALVRSPGARRARAAALGAGLALARAALLLTWNGSLLYLLLLDGLLLAWAAAAARRDALLALAGSALVTCALVAPVAATWRPPIGGPWSAVALSRLHLLALCGLAVLALLAFAGERWRPAPGAGVRLARLAGVAAALAALLLVSLREPAAQVLLFLTKRDVAGAATAEQFPLLPIGAGVGAGTPGLHFGWLAWLVPLAPLAPLLAGGAPRVRAARRFLAAWAAPLALLTVTQVRYGNEAAPALAVCFALAAARAVAWLRARVPAPLAVGAVLVAGALALAPGLRGPLAGAPATWAWLRGAAAPGDPLLATPAGSLVRFAETVRALTPETTGFLAADGAPEYVVLANANVGHPLRYYARRPLPMDGFWGYVDPETFRRAEQLLGSADEGEALARAEALGVRYVVTLAGPPRRDALDARLHADDGRAAAGLPRFERVRLVAEGPAGGRPLVDLFGARRPARVVPYKLFEIVPGAVLAVRAAPGTPVEASVRVVSPLGRGFDYVATARAGPNGEARLRVPYATRTDRPVRPAGPWRVRIGGAERRVEVDEAAVRSGDTVAVPTAP